VARLNSPVARAVGTTVLDLRPTRAPPHTLAVLRDQARRLIDTLLQAADRGDASAARPVPLARPTQPLSGSRPLCWQNNSSSFKYVTG
jgi:hypothetical protein